MHHILLQLIISANIIFEYQYFDQYNLQSAMGVLNKVCLGRPFEHYFLSLCVRAPGMLKRTQNCGACLFAIISWPANINKQPLTVNTDLMLSQHRLEVMNTEVKA